LNGQKVGAFFTKYLFVHKASFYTFVRLKLKTNKKQNIMKKIYSLLLASVVAVAAFAQSTANFAIPNIAPKSPVSIPQKPVYTMATNQFIIDYDTADAAAQANFGFPSNRYIWDFNYAYTAADTFTRKYFVVAFDSMYDVYGNIGYARSTVSTIRCDSIYMVLGQENNSGTDDTVRIKLVSVNVNGYPTTTALWTYDYIIPGNAPLGTDWLQAAYIAIPCGYTVATNDRFALRVEYLGNKMDTCGWLASYGQQTLGSCTDAAARTEFSPYKMTGPGYYNANTFAHWNQFSAFVPNAAGQNVYYECDGLPGYLYTGDGENYMQNMSVWVMVTTDPLGVNENDGLTMQINQNKPNPFNGNTTISYELSKQASSVSLVIYDVTGKQVMNFNEGKQTSGKHDITIDGSNLEAGVYFYSVVADGVKMTSKMTVVK